MQWLRLYHGTSKDPKLAACAQKARCLRAEAVAVWVFVLEHASEATDRGSVSGLTAEIISVTFNMDEEVAQAILDQFRDRGMITNDRITAWDKRQRRTDDVADRVRRHRKKKADETVSTVIEAPNSVTETERNANVTLQGRENPGNSEPCNVTPSVLFCEQNIDNNNTARTRPVFEVFEPDAEPVSQPVAEQTQPTPKPPGRDPNSHALIQSFSDAIVQVFGQDHARPSFHSTDGLWADRFMAVAAEVSIAPDMAIDMLRQHFVDQLTAFRDRGNSPPKVLKFFLDSAPKLLRDFARDRDMPASTGRPSGSSHGRKPFNSGDAATSTAIRQPWQDVQSRLVAKHLFAAAKQLSAAAAEKGDAMANLIAASLEEQHLGKKRTAAQAA